MKVITDWKILRNKVEEEFDFDNPQIDPKEFKEIIIDAMWENSGLGISANQIGYNFRVFAMRGETKKDSVVCFNPEIKTFSDNMNTMEEGCLSIPECFVKVVRPAEVSISYLNENRKKEGQLATGLTARVFQHELDHLDGIAMLDRVGSFTARYAQDKARKRLKALSRGKPVKPKFAL